MIRFFRNSRNAVRIITIVLTVLSFPAVLKAQSQISQNQDGFESSLYEGNLNAIPRRDSTVIQREVPKDYIQWRMNPRTGLMDTASLDTLQYLFQNQHKTEGLRSTYSNLANLGSPRISRLFSEQSKAPFFIFDTPLSLFIQNPTDFLFTDTKTPHLNLTYFNGGNKTTGEDHIKGYFAANFGKKVGIGLNMDYIYGRGRYSNQSTSMFDTRAYGYYHGDIYQAHVSFNADQIKYAENGGIADDKYITEPEMMSEGKKQYEAHEIPVKLSSTWNNLQRNQVLIAQSINLRDSYQRTDSIGDTIITRTLHHEIGNIANTTEFGFLKRRFIAHSTPKYYYQDEWLINDSVDTFRNFYLDNTVSLNINEGFSKWAVAGFSAFAKYELRSYTMADTLEAGPKSEYRKRENEFNILIGGALQREHGKNLNLGVRAQTVVLGDALGDFNVNGNIDLGFNIFRQPAALTGRAILSGETPDYYMRHFHSQHYWWDTSLKKEIRLRAEGELRIDRTHTHLTAGVTDLNNYTYLADYGQIQTNGTVLKDIRAGQESSDIQVIDATLNQDIRLGILHWDNSITWQYSSNQDILPLPQLNVFSNLYLKFKYFKKMDIEFGGDVTWFTEYYAPDYSPAAGQFYTQNENSKVKVGNYPLINAYLN